MSNRNTVTLLILLLFSVFLSCRPFLSFKTEVERINHEAEELLDDAGKILPTALATAVETGIEAINTSLQFSEDPRILRVVALYSARLLAREAVTMIVMKKAGKFDRIFGSDHSEAVCSMLLNTYCYPMLDTIIAEAVERGIRRFDPSSSGDTASPEIDSLIASYSKAFGLDQAVDIIKGFGSIEKTPEYYSTIDRRVVNSDTYASTINWKDHGLVYQYRITGRKLEKKCSDGPWEELQMPGGRIPAKVAADNNRCFILTEDRELWWYCAKQDQAQWSIDIMQTAVEVMALTPVAGDQVCGRLIPLIAEITDSVATRASADKLLRRWRNRETVRSLDYWNDKCKAWSDVALSVDKLLLKTGDDSSFTAEDYAVWSRNAHAEGAWSNLLTWSSGETTFRRGNNLPVDSITDIAVGNWNGTVVTMYILAQGKIWFIDEEIIHPEWKQIEKWNAKWALIANEYHDIQNSPYPLDLRSRIDASNSVIAVSQPSDSGCSIYWLRWDYHQKDDFVYWPLDWCEHKWYAVACPPVTSGHFSISTTGTIDPRENGTVWSIPAPAFTFHNYLPAEGYKGIFGDIPREQVSTYPVDLFVTDTTDTIRRFSAERTGEVTSSEVKWKVF